MNQLVNLTTLDAGLRFDLRYATANNFTHRQLYPTEAGVWLHKAAATALVQVQRDLQLEGLGLKIFDAYRPFHIQQLMWSVVGDERYVCDPSKEPGRHTRGTAVDLTLVDSWGCELGMPTEFDEFSDMAHRHGADISEPSGRNSLLLAQIMARHGFIPYGFEWWHFDYMGWEKYPPLDASLKTLK